MNVLRRTLFGPIGSSAYHLYWSIIYIIWNSQFVRLSRVGERSLSLWYEQYFLLWSWEHIKLFTTVTYLCTPHHLLFLYTDYNINHRPLPYCLDCDLLHCISCVTLDVSFDAWPQSWPKAVRLNVLKICWLLKTVVIRLSCILSWR
jgi:hypothetical protein